MPVVDDPCPAALSGKRRDGNIFVEGHRFRIDFLPCVLIEDNAEKMMEADVVMIDFHLVLSKRFLRSVVDRLRTFLRTSTMGSFSHELALSGAVRARQKYR